MFGNEDIKEIIETRYPVGTRVRLISMDDTWSHLQKGDEGTVEHIDDIGTIFVHWDCGSSLGLIVGIDRFEKIEKDGYSYNEFDR